jgi:hypothetical protein
MLEEEQKKAEIERGKKGLKRKKMKHRSASKQSTGLC